MSVCGSLPLPNRLHDLKAVQFRHVDVQDQQVEATFFREGQSLPAVARQPHAVTLSDEHLLQDLSAQLVVLGHEDVQRCRRRDRRRDAGLSGREPVSAVDGPVVPSDDSSHGRLFLATRPAGPA